LRVRNEVLYLIRKQKSGEKKRSYFSPTLVQSMGRGSVKTLCSNIYYGNYFQNIDFGTQLSKSNFRFAQRWKAI
jgi:hypothetical protein